eukprot:CAMPEP_0182527140 /NCGR_PEP_ID=MMETSP1323-20130603/3657_1 /TAXON_ID=236787 /ORGANISM="Florenciella parvula, Strain RCC1693" /LENGTH=205 /DNA_ID=CAMNT_0024736095 /DNA_START=602 /DNA_END=1220 /DNA_ORIENTATION=+
MTQELTDQTPWTSPESQSHTAVPGPAVSVSPAAAPQAQASLAEQERPLFVTSFACPLRVRRPPVAFLAGGDDTFLGQLEHHPLTRRTSIRSALHYRHLQHLRDDLRVVHMNTVAKMPGRRARIARSMNRALIRGRRAVAQSVTASARPRLIAWLRLFARAARSLALKGLAVYAHIIVVMSPTPSTSPVAHSIHWNLNELSSSSSS